MPRPSRPWFRFYVEAVHDRKLRRLRPEYRWLFVVCLAAARQSPSPGRLLVAEDDPMSHSDLADFAGMPPRSIRQGMHDLVAAGVVVLDGETYVIPAWEHRQFESDDITARTRKHRLERSNDVPGNAPETEAETYTPPTPPVADFDPHLTKHSPEQREANLRLVAEAKSTLHPTLDPQALEG